MVRSLLALSLIVGLALALLIFDSVGRPSQNEFLNAARDQKHTLLLLLAAQAALIAILTSRITDRAVYNR